MTLLLLLNGASTGVQTPFVPQIYTADLLCNLFPDANMGGNITPLVTLFMNITPAANLDGNPSPAGDADSNPSPSKETYSG